MSNRGTLTKRDKKEILDLASYGYQPQKIAKTLGLEQRDVYNFLKKGGRKNVQRAN